MQPAHRLAAQAARRAVRAQLRAIQRFVRIDVADASEGGLVQKDRLERGAAAAQALEELVGVECRIDRLGPELGQRARYEQLILGAEQEPPEPARVAVPELMAVVQVEHRVSVARDLRRRVDKAQLPAHAQVNNKKTSRTERDQDELSAPADRLDLLSGNGVNERLGLWVTDDRGKPQLAVQDRASDEMRPQVSGNGLNFGEFRP